VLEADGGEWIYSSVVPFRWYFTAISAVWWCAIGGLGCVFAVKRVGGSVRLCQGRRQHHDEDIFPIYGSSY
jgi:hypothetical protein